MNVAHAPSDPKRALHRARLLLTAAVAVLVAAIALVVVHNSSNGSSSNGITGSGIAATQARSLAPFTSVLLAGSNNVAIRVGPKQSVVVHADTNLLRVVTTHVRAGTLVIGNTPGSFAAKSPMSVEVSVPSLNGLTLSGSGNVAVSGVNTPTMTVTLPGSGNLRASGTTTRLNVTISGSGNAELQQLAARDAHAVVSGSGTIWLTASNSLDASVPGSGAIFYRGHPGHLTTTITGSGAITQG